MKTTLNPFENAKRTAQGTGGGVSPAVIEEMQAEISILGSPYSTTEHKTGRKWIDGKDIFEKVVVFESAVSVGTSWTNLGVSNTDIDAIIHANGLHADGSFYPLILDLHNSEQATTLYAKASASIDVSTLILNYTKTGA